MKFVRRLLLIILLVIIVVLSFIIYNGNLMYKDAIAEMPLDKKVIDIQNDVNFVSKDEVPDYYLNAVIAVEDHRFKEHGAIFKFV